MPTSADPRWDAELDRYMRSMARIQTDPTMGGLATGAREWDWQLYQMGRAWLDRASRSGQTVSPRPAAPRPRPVDVYLASQVYELGGHTGLIGDCVRALDDAEAHVIITNLFGANSSPLSDLMVDRLGVDRQHITVVPGPTPGDRLQQTLTALVRLRPDRLFLFHHPQDPLASVVAQPELAGRRILVHHADATSSFGLHVPGVTIVDLNPSALAPTRFIGCESVLLPLTAADPGPRPVGFLRRGRLVTASCGNPHKFQADYVFGYPDTVGLMLQATGGWHLHVGPLDDDALQVMHEALNRRGVPVDRFLHVPSTTSVAATLWDHGCDLYVASFPVGGARTKIEVLASGTPYLRHARLPAQPGAPPSIDEDGLNAWRTWEDLVGTLHRLSDLPTLEAHASFARTLYERVHHPHVFRRRLRAIVEGGAEAEVIDASRLQATMQIAMWRSPDARLAERDATDAMNEVRRSLCDARVELERLRAGADAAAIAADRRLSAAESAVEQLGGLLEQQAGALRAASAAERQAMQTQIEALRAQVLGFEAALGEHRQRRDAWTEGRGLRASVRRWLTPT